MEYIELVKNGNNITEKGKFLVIVLPTSCSFGPLFSFELVIEIVLGPCGGKLGDKEVSDDGVDLS